VGLTHCCCFVYTVVMRYDVVGKGYDWVALFRSDLVDLKTEREESSDQIRLTTMSYDLYFETHDCFYLIVVEIATNARNG
jgi:hypothetical protein